MGGVTVFLESREGDIPRGGRDPWGGEIPVTPGSSVKIAGGTYLLVRAQ